LQCSLLILRCRLLIRSDVMDRRVMVAVCAALLTFAVGCARPAGSVETKDSSADESAAGEREIDAAGVKGSTNAARSVRISVENTDAAESAVAARGDGTAYVVWVEHRGKEADVMLARVNADGQPQGTPTRVNPEAGRATAWRGDPPTIVAAPDGSLYVGWTARVDSAGGHADDLYLSASRDEGHTFTPTKVNDDRKPAVHGMHSLALAPDGRIHLAWLDERDTAAPRPSGMAEGHHMESNREVFASYSIDGGRTFSPNRRIATQACPCCKTALAIGPEGRLYVGWRQVLPNDFRHIAVASSKDGGRTFAQPVIVSDDRCQIAGCPVSGPALAVTTDGALRVLWYSEGETGETGLYWSESRDGGRSFAPRRRFDASGARGTPVLTNAGGFLANTDGSLTNGGSSLTNGGGHGLIAVWEGGGSTHPMAARLSEDGEIGGVVALADSGQLPAAAVAGGQVFIAYISETNGGRGVWLARTDR
jgi:hypothetical protein